MFLLLPQGFRVQEQHVHLRLGKGLAPWVLVILAVQMMQGVWALSQCVAIAQAIVVNFSRFTTASNFFLLSPTQSFLECVSFCGT